MIAAEVYVSVNDVALEEYQIKLRSRSWWMWRQTSAMRPCFWICSDHDRTNMNKLYVMDSMNRSSRRNERRLLPLWLRNASQLETNLFIPIRLVCLELKEAQHLLSPQRIAHAEGTKKQSWVRCRVHRWSSDESLGSFSLRLLRRDSDDIAAFCSKEKGDTVYGICIQIESLKETKDCEIRQILDQPWDDKNLQCQYQVWSL